MMAKYVTFKKIGNFLGYGIKNIFQYGQEENFIATQSHVGSLMTMFGIDLIKLTKFLGVNSFTNLDLLDSVELTKGEVDLGSINDCHSQLKSNSAPKDEVFADIEKSSNGIFLKPSPCHNVTAFPSCKTYCEWHANAIKHWLPNAIRMILEYET